MTFKKIDRADSVSGTLIGYALWALVSAFSLYGVNWIASMLLPKILYYSTIGVFGATAVGVMVVHIIIRLPEREKKAKIVRDRRAIPLPALAIPVLSFMPLGYAILAIMEVGFISPRSVALVALCPFVSVLSAASWKISKNHKQERPMAIVITLLASIFLIAGTMASITKDIAVMKGISFSQQKGEKKQ
jgi:hypothetical protein